MQRMRARAVASNLGTSVAPSTNSTAAHPIELDSSPVPAPLSANIRSHAPSSDDFASMLGGPAAGRSSAQRTPDRLAARRSDANSHAVLDLTDSVPSLEARRSHGRAAAVSTSPRNGHHRNPIPPSPVSFRVDTSTASGARARSSAQRPPCSPSVDAAVMLSSGELADAAGGSVAERSNLRRSLREVNGVVGSSRRAKSPRSAAAAAAERRRSLHAWPFDEDDDEDVAIALPRGGAGPAARHGASAGEARVAAGTARSSFNVDLLDSLGSDAMAVSPLAVRGAAAASSRGAAGSGDRGESDVELQMALLESASGQPSTGPSSGYAVDGAASNGATMAEPALDGATDEGFGLMRGLPERSPARARAELRAHAEQRARFRFANSGAAVGPATAGPRGEEMTDEQLAQALQQELWEQEQADATAFDERMAHQLAGVGAGAAAGPGLHLPPAHDGAAARLADVTRPARQVCARRGNGSLHKGATVSVSIGHGVAIQGDAVLNACVPAGGRGGARGRAGAAARRSFGHGVRRCDCRAPGCCAPGGSRLDCQQRFSTILCAPPRAAYARKHGRCAVLATECTLLQVADGACFVRSAPTTSGPLSAELGHFGAPFGGGWQEAPEATYEELLQLEDVKVTASRDAVGRLRQLTAGSAEAAAVKETACLVCQEDWAEGDVLNTLHCGHTFHASCVQRWLKEYSNKCPVCKAAVQ